jgi:hypothetical protein
MEQLGQAGGNMNTTRKHLLQVAAGTQTAALAVGGQPGSAPYFTTASEAYNGASWTKYSKYE